MNLIPEGRVKRGADARGPPEHLELIVGANCIRPIKQGFVGLPGKTDKNLI